ncbi:MAG: 50S ribosomal protein L10 [Candidatus Omnitrophica bacterium]|nr:50S ribosomal protein L10 [Candidatus Omnitrophota bacterium]MCM8826988.1 50S ribosomal protein L10 [Candidatus Omnitrophota bacterium]
MKRVGLIYREKIIELLLKEWDNTDTCLLVGFDKVKAFNLNQLRNELRKEKSKMFVSKKSLIARAFQDKGISCDSNLLAESKAIVFVSDDMVKITKLLLDFSKENEGFSLKGGFIKDKPLTFKQLEEIADLPSKEVLIGMAVMAIASPLTGFLGTMKNIILKFIWLIEELKKKKG